MATKRHTIHLDIDDLRTLTRLARAETKLVGSRVTAAGIIRRTIKEYLRTVRRGATGR